MPWLTPIAQSPTPSIHVTVSSGSDSLTTVIAVLGLVLAGLSLVWQYFTWRLSGSRVQVDARFCIFPAHMPGVGMPADLLFPLDDKLMAALQKQGFPLVMVVATIRNTGRLPVTIQRCKWQTEAEAIETPNAPPGVPFPHRLAEHDQCISVIDLKTLLAVFDAPYRDPLLSRREVWPVVEVAHKRRPVRGKPLSIPAAQAAPEASAAAP